MLSLQNKEISTLYFWSEKHHDSLALSLFLFASLAWTLADSRNDDLWRTGLSMLFRRQASPSHGHGLRGTNAGSLTAHKVRMPVDEHEFIYVAALSDKGQLQVDIIWGEKDASVAVKGPMPQLRE